MTTQLQNSLNVQQAIEHVIAKQSLSYAQAKTLFDQIMQGNMSDIELSALLISLKMKGEISDEIAGAAASMRENAVAFITNKTQLADSCGTGGDGSSTINISTTAAVVAAAAGVNMVKHGNRSVSSNSGSADLLKALGINIDMTPTQAAKCLEHTNFTFLFAPHYHSGVRHAMNVRTTLKTRTIFNILGPLANPAAPDVQLLGVYDESLCLPMAQTLHTLGTKRAMIVHGSGTDEIALHGPTQVVELDNGKITQYTLNPSDFDLANYSLEQLAGEGPQYNANASLAILQGKGSEAHNAAIIVNVAALLYLTGQAQSLKQGAQITHSLLRSGKAMDTLNAIIEVSHANVLDKIIADKKIELIERKAARPLESFKHQAKPTTRSFYQALTAPGTQFILECKKASPSKGLIRQPFNLTEITQAYKQYATCMSVLTDEKYFQGSFDYLEFVRSQVEQPLICKDFFIDEYQVYMARLYGGDAILLMLSVLDDQQYKALHAVADSLNMSVLTEVSNEEEVHRALALNAQIIGINNRDLRDLSTDLATTERLRKLIPNDKVVISESGIYTHQDVKRLAPLCNGFLIGSSLMAEADLLQACRSVILGENKVCGLTHNQDAIAAYDNGALYGGLIFYPKSPRFVDLDCAKEISQSAPLKFVGVFVNAAIAEVAEHAKQLKLSAVQLHGQEDEHYIASLRNELPRHCEIWKAQAIKNALPQPITGADRHLYDTHSDSQAGGTGKTFDWSVLRDATTPFMLAGGLNPDNISDALFQGALGLDLNSGVEESPGKKCANKLHHAFTSIRNY